MIEDPGTTAPPRRCARRGIGLAEHDVDVGFTLHLQQLGCCRIGWLRRRRGVSARRSGDPAHHDERQPSFHCSPSWFPSSVGPLGWFWGLGLSEVGYLKLQRDTRCG